jgi:hypothetical protein
MRLPQLRWQLGRLNIFARRLRMHTRFQRTDHYVPSLIVFTHEPSILSVGDHLAAVRLRFGFHSQTSGPLLDATGSLVILIGITGEK